MPNHKNDFLKPLSKRIALVTGASRGIGHTIASELARQGAIVVGTATSEAGAEALQNTLSDFDCPVKGFVLDVTNRDQLEAIIMHIQKEYGKLDILVNNAGITADQLALRMRDDLWDKVIETNLSAVFRLSRSALRLILKSDTGRIINISSIVGVIGNIGQVNYAAAKAGVIGITKALARELAKRGITVNCVAPGFIKTDMTETLSEQQQVLLKSQIPLGVLGRPEDIADAVGFLASSKAAYITGTTLHVNGGMCMN